MSKGRGTAEQRMGKFCVNAKQAVWEQRRNSKVPRGKRDYEPRLARNSTRERLTARKWRCCHRY